MADSWSALPAMLVQDPTLVPLLPPMPCFRLEPSFVRFENNYLAEMWSSSKEGSYLRLIDCRITELVYIYIHINIHVGGGT